MESLDESNLLQHVMFAQINRIRLLYFTTYQERYLTFSSFQTLTFKANFVAQQPRLSLLFSEALTSCHSTNNSECTLIKVLKTPFDYFPRETIEDFGFGKKSRNTGNNNKSHLEELRQNVIINVGFEGLPQISSVYLAILLCNGNVRSVADFNFRFPCSLNLNVAWDFRIFNARRERKLGSISVTYGQF